MTKKARKNGRKWVVDGLDPNIESWSILFTHANGCVLIGRCAKYGTLINDAGSAWEEVYGDGRPINWGDSQVVNDKWQQLKKYITSMGKLAIFSVHPDKTRQNSSPRYGPERMQEGMDILKKALGRRKPVESLRSVFNIVVGTGAPFIAPFTDRIEEEVSQLGATVEVWSRTSEENQRRINVFLDQLKELMTDLGANTQAFMQTSELVINDLSSDVIDARMKKVFLEVKRKYEATVLERNERRDAINQLTKDKIQLQAQIEGLLQERTGDATSVNALRAELTQKDEQIMELTRFSSGQTDEIARLKAGLEAANLIIDDLNVKLTEKSSKIAELEFSRSALQVLKDELGRRYGALHWEKDQQTVIIQTLKKKLDDTAAALKEVTESSLVEMTDLRETMVELQQRVSESNESAQTQAVSEEEKNELLDQLKQLEKLVEESARELETLASELAEKDEVVSQLQVKVQMAERARDEALAEKATVENQLTELKTQMEGQNAAAYVAADTEKTLRGQVQGQEADLRSLGQQVEELGQREQAYEEKINKMSQQIVDLKRELERAATQKATLERELNESAMTVSIQAGSLGISNDEIVSLNNKLGETTKELETLRGVLTVKEKKISELKGVIALLNAEMSGVVSELEKQTASSEQLAAELKDFESRFSALKESSETKLVESARALAEKAAEAKAKQDEVNVMMERQTELDNEIRTLRTTIEELKRENVVLREAEEKAKIAEEVVDNLQESKEELNSQAQSLVREVQNLKAGGPNGVVVANRRQVDLILKQLMSIKTTEKRTDQELKAAESTLAQERIQARQQEEKAQMMMIQARQVAQEASRSHMRTIPTTPVRVDGRRSATETGREPTGGGSRGTSTGVLVAVGGGMAMMASFAGTVLFGGV
jgi:chromosome segregation ATPase